MNNFKKKKKLPCFQFTDNRRQRPLEDQQGSCTIWTSNPSNQSFSPLPLVLSFRSLCQLPCHPALPPQCTADSVFRVFHLVMPLLGILPLTQPPSLLPHFLQVINLKTFTVKPDSTMMFNAEICILFPGFSNPSHLLYFLFLIACFHLCSCEMINLFYVCFFN